MVAMDQKIPRTMKLPPEIDGVWAEITKSLPGKQHWVAATAMVVMFAESSERTRNEYMRRVKQAESPGGSFDELATEAMKKMNKPPMRIAARPKDE